jgi:integrase
MERLHFTKALIATLPLPASGARTYADAKVQPLNLRVSATGARTWNVLKWNRVTRRPKRISIGPYPSVNVEMARRRAQELIAALDQGRDPIAEREAQFEFPTLGELSDAHARRLAATGCRHPNYLQYLIRLGLNDWINRRVNTLTQREVSERHDRIAGERGNVAAARTVKALRTLFNHAERDLGLTLRNVARAVRVKDSQPRARYMSKDEERKLLAVLPAETQDAQDYIRLLMLTGARRDNVAGLRWTDVDWIEQSWTIPAGDAKAGAPITVPLMPPAVEILERRRLTLGEDVTYCFPTRAADGRLKEVWFMWTRIKARAVLLDAGMDWRGPKPRELLASTPADAVKNAPGLRDMTIHDLRRTMAVRMVGAGASLPVIAAALGHRNLKTTQQVYALATQQDVRAAMAKAL